MTSGYVNLSAPLENLNSGNPNWIGLKGYKSWDGGDKTGAPKSEIPSPRAPISPSNQKGAFTRQYNPGDAPFAENSRRGRADKRAREQASDPAPFGGSDTVLWRDVIRMDNAKPSRANAEYHNYTMNTSMVRQGLGNALTAIRQRSDGSWETATTETTPEAWCGLPVFTHTWSSQDDYVLLEKLRSKVAGSDFNTGVFLGESREAVKMIGQKASQIARALRYAKRGQLVDAAKALGVSPRASLRPQHRRKGRETSPGATAASNWLELQYGWLPLLKDVHGGAEFLAHHLNVPLKKRYRVRRLAKGTAQSASPVNYSLGSGFCETRGQLIAIVSEADVAQLTGLQDPATIAWELLPFSFIADWFVPVGSWLSSRGLRSALTGTFIKTLYRVNYARGYVETPHSYPYAVPKDYETREVTVSRQVTSELAVPMPSVVPLNEVLSWKRAANAVALITVLASGRPLPHGVTNG